MVPRGGCWLPPRDLIRWHLPWRIPQPLAPSLGGSETCFCWHTQKGPICQENTPINPDHETKIQSTLRKGTALQNRTAEAVVTSTVSPWKQSCLGRDVIIIKFPDGSRIIWNALEGLMASDTDCLLHPFPRRERDNSRITQATSLGRAGLPWAGLVWTLPTDLWLVSCLSQRLRWPNSIWT